MRAFIAGVGVRGPGLDGWDASRAILANEAAYEPREIVLPPPALLSATERRRAGPVTRLALAVAQEASDMAGLPSGSTRSVFGSSNGDGAVIGSILDALTTAEAQVSPTQFHNSVHNAAAGYWSIATGSTQPATSLGCHDSTFAASLLKAMAELEADRVPVLLCVYDMALPAPLAAKRPIFAPFGMALLLQPDAQPGALAEIEAAYVAVPPNSVAPRLAALHDLSRGNPAAHGVPLLELLARGQSGALSLGLLDGRLDVTVRPCA